MDQLIKQRIVSLSATRGAGLILSQIDFSRSLPYFVKMASPQVKSPLADWSSLSQEMPSSTSSSFPPFSLRPY